MTTARCLRAAALFLALVLAPAWFLLPTQFGGGTTFVSTHGVSMAPRFSTGDLAVLRRADGYAVGDVVAYRSPTLRTTVLHRIVATDGPAFTTRGDANSWQDPDHPTAADVLGRLQFRIPHGGQALATLRSPWLLLTGTAGLLMIGTRRRQRGRHRTGHRPGSARPVSLPVQAGARRATAVLGAVTVLAALTEAGLLLAPSTQTTTATVPVQQAGQYAYSATAVPGATYPTGAITTGDPVYTRLASGLTVTLTETVSAPGLTGLAGDLRLGLSLSTPDGWRAELGGGPATSFTVTDRGRASTATVAVDPAAAEQLLARHASEVGPGHGGSATITVTPVLRATATVGTRPVPLAALAPVALTLDDEVLRLAAPAPALAPTTSTAVPVLSTGPRELALPVLPVPLRVARLAGALLLAAAGLGWLVAARLGRPGTDAAGDVLVRFAGRLVPVSALTTSGTVVDVDDADALHRIAQRLDCLVLHHRGGTGHVFAVQDQDTTYRLVVAAPAPERPVVPLLQPA